MKRNECRCHITQLFTHILSSSLSHLIVCSLAKCSLEHIKCRVDFFFDKKKDERVEGRTRVQLSKSAHTKSIKEIYLSFNMSSADYLTMKWKSEQLPKWNPNDFSLSRLLSFALSLWTCVDWSCECERDPDDLSRFQN